MGRLSQGLRPGLSRLAGPLTGLGSESSDWLTYSTNFRLRTLGDGSPKPEESNAWQCPREDFVLILTPDLRLLTSDSCLLTSDF